MTETVLTDTYRLRSLDGGTIPSGRYVWRGPKGAPVFHLENCREIVIHDVRVECQTPTDAVFLSERTKTGPGTIAPTLLQFRNVKIIGNGLATVGINYAATIDENNEHGRFDCCSVYGCAVAGFAFSGQQSKEHVLTLCRVESCLTGIEADSGFTMIGGTIAACGEAVSLERAGDPVLLAGVGVEACGRLLVTDGPTTASQPVTLSGVRYEADQLHADGNAIIVGHAGPLTLQGCRLGGGKQRIPRIMLRGTGEQTAVISGNTFGAYGAHRVCPIRATNPTYARVEWGRNTYQRFANDPTNTEGRIEWAQRYFA